MVNLSKAVKLVKPNAKKPWEKFSLLDVIILISLTALAFVMLFPFYNAIVLAFNDGRDAAMGGVYFWPRVPTLDNFRQVFSNNDIFNAFFISISRTLLGTMLSLMIMSMFAYAVSRSNLMFRRFYLVLLVFAMYFQGGVIANFLLIRNLGLYNSFLALILPGSFNVLFAMIFVTFFKGLPDAILEAARIDGASNIMIYFRIVLPLSGPVLAAIGLFTALNHWNSWFDHMLYAPRDGLQSLAYLFTKMIMAQQYIETGSVADAALMQQIGVSSKSLQLAAMVVATAPIMFIYPFLQKYFTKGIMIGSVKG